jgi:hypothetical protein
MTILYYEFGGTEIVQFHNQGKPRSLASLDGPFGSAQGRLRPSPHNLFYAAWPGVIATGGSWVLVQV